MAGQCSNLKPESFSKRGFRGVAYCRADIAITAPGVPKQIAGRCHQEIADALGVAVAMNAGAALVYSARTLDAVDTALDA